MTDEEIKALQDAIYREKVERARRMSPQEKMEAGQELFEMATRQIGGGSRGIPLVEAEDRRRKELRRRLAIKRRLDEQALAKSYRP